MAALTLSTCSSVSAPPTARMKSGTLMLVLSSSSAHSRISLRTGEREMKWLVTLDFQRTPFLTPL